MKNFEVDLLNEAKEFVDSFDLATRKKIYYCIALAKSTNDPELFKKITGSNIWEFRILFKRKKYRLFSFWDANRKSYVICTHGIIKKTDKIPQKEIDKAEKIRIKYNEYHGKRI